MCVLGQHSVMSRPRASRHFQQLPGVFVLFMLPLACPRGGLGEALPKLPPPPAQSGTLCLCLSLAPEAPRPRKGSGSTGQAPVTQRLPHPCAGAAPHMSAWTCPCMASVCSPALRASLPGVPVLRVVTGHGSSVRSRRGTAVCPFGCRGGGSQGRARPHSGHMAPGTGSRPGTQVGLVCLLGSTQQLAALGWPSPLRFTGRRMTWGGS